MPTFEEIRDDLVGGLLIEFKLSNEITEQTTLRLNQLSRDDVLAVHTCAQYLFAARRLVVEECDGDMDTVIETFDAILAALVPWLKRNGIIHTINESRAS
jgi:hypothetical protein